MYLLNILAITDIHGHKEYFNSLKAVLSKKEIDCIIICGDITNFGTKNDAMDILGSIKEFDIPLFAIPGNCDQREIVGVLDELEINLHEKKALFNEYALYGFGGSNITPFGTPFETEDDTIYEKVAPIVQDDLNKIFVFHAPPYNTKLDFIGNDHVGSKSIRKLIEEFEPTLVLCGHIHEARGLDRIGDTLVVNPGVFGYGEIAIVHEEEKVEFIYI